LELPVQPIREVTALSDQSAKSVAAGIVEANQFHNFVGNQKFDRRIFSVWFHFGFFQIEVSELDHFGLDFGAVFEALGFCRISHLNETPLLWLAELPAGALSHYRAIDVRPAPLSWVERIVNPTPRFCYFLGSAPGYSFRSKFYR